MELKNNEILSNKSLSKITPDDSNEDKNQISLSESNDLFNYQTPKKMLSDMTQLSKRVRKEEYENAFSNKAKAEVLRNKYIPTFKSFINESIYQKTSSKVSPIKEKIRIRFNKLDFNKNKIIDKKILKPNINLKSINNNEKVDDIYNDKITIFDFSSKMNFFSELLKEDNNDLYNIKIMKKNELLKIKNDKEKIIVLLDKNKETLEEMKNIEKKYKRLRNEYIDLYKNINSIYIKNTSNNLININNDYENYITNQNIKLKKELEIYENILLSMTNYINDISKLFSLNQIDYIEMKQNIRSSNNISDITKAKIIEKLNENIKAISQIMKEKILKKNIRKY